MWAPVRTRPSLTFFFLRVLATATQRRRPRFQRTAFHPETRPDRADTSVSVRGGVSVFSRNALLLRTTIFLFRSRVRARRRGGDRCARIESKHDIRRRVCLVTSSHDNTQRVTRSCRCYLSPISRPTRMFIAASSLAWYLNTNGYATRSTHAPVLHTRHTTLIPAVPTPAPTASRPPAFPATRSAHAGASSEPHREHTSATCLSEHACRRSWSR